MAIVTLKAEDIAKELGTTAPIIKSSILNGTMPIGLVGTGEGGRDRIIIIKARFDKWIAGEDLSKAV